MVQGPLGLLEGSAASRGGRRQSELAWQLQVLCRGLCGRGLPPRGEGVTHGDAADLEYSSKLSKSLSQAVSQSDSESEVLFTYFSDKWY